MERNTQQTLVSTKESAKQAEPQNRADPAGVFLTPTDAEEYRLYKKRKKLTEISTAISRCVSFLSDGEDIQRVCERAARLRIAAVKTPPSKLVQTACYLANSTVKIDCIVGGNGETLAKVKAYETRLALRKKASEITLVLAPSNVDGCRYGEIRREVKRMRRAAGKAAVKVRVDKISSPTSLARIARIASDCGAKYFSVPYFTGCEKLRLDLTNGCLLEVSGVEDLEIFRKLTEIGVARIVTNRAWEIYSEWLQEAQAISAPAKAEEKKTEDKKPNAWNESKATDNTELAAPPKPAPPTAPSAPPVSLPPKNPETDYRCRLEGTSLKFF